MIKRVLKALALLLVATICIIVILVLIPQKPLTPEGANAHLELYFQKASQPKDDFSGIQALVVSDQLGIHLKTAYGIAGDSTPLTADHPFHIASVGKLFTAVVIYQLADEGQLDLDASIGDYLSPERLKGLFIADGTDYTSDVTIRHLLSHTSGIADYFSGSVLNGETIEARLKSDPDHLYTPDELLDFSANNQQALGLDVYQYSDTGFLLLGKLIETVAQDSVEAVFEQRFFKPLNMDHTYMGLRSEPAVVSTLPLADIWLNSQEISKTNVLSVDWTGGGLVSTLDDLLRFNQALHSGQLVSDQYLAELFSNQNKFENGIYTGGGGMTIRFNELFPLLTFDDVNGHIGILSTHLFYDSTTETHIILNYGSDQQMVNSFKGLIETLATLNRIEFQ